MSNIKEGVYEVTYGRKRLICITPSNNDFTQIHHQDIFEISMSLFANFYKMQNRYFISI